MKTPNSPAVTGAPPVFLEHCGDAVTGVLSGFARLRLRGTLRHRFQPTVMEAYLNACRVLIKDFGTFAQGLTARIKAAAYATAEPASRPFRFLPSSQTSKEDLALPVSCRCRSLLTLFRAHGAWKRGSKCPAAIRRQSISLTSWFPPAIPGPESLSENFKWACGCGFWRWPRRRGLRIPSAGCPGRASAAKCGRSAGL